MRQKLLKEMENIFSGDYTYDEGHPLKYKNEFQKMWMIHMEYLNSVQVFKTPKVNKQIFIESMNKFINKHKEVRLFVVKEKSSMIGFLQAGIAPNNKYGFISDFHVLEQYRNYGLGKRLINNCLTWFSKNNIKDIGLEVTGGNEKVLEFYKRNGFIIESYNLRKME